VRVAAVAYDLERRSIREPKWRSEVKA